MNVPANQHTRRLLTDALTFVPGVGRLSMRFGHPGPASARYGYAVWLRHVIAAGLAELPTKPTTLVEIGPGESLATGLAAILSGAQHYYAWDIVRYTAVAENLSVFEQLVKLFQSRAEPPEGEFSKAMFRRDFPRDVLTDADLRRSLAPDRLAAIREAIVNPGVEHDGIKIDYRSSLDHLERPADMFLSQAVMEHVDDYAEAYAAMFDALVGGGIISHEIDFQSHHFAHDWNGHWTFGEAEWRIVRGRRTYAINRAPLHLHLAAIEAAGFDVAPIHRIVESSRLDRSQLHPSFASMPIEDVTTASALIQARKPS